MSNKLPWFTHDHDAHEDEFLQAVMDKFGVAGYAYYFITLELIHKHGVGDVLVMGAGRYAKHLRSRLDRVKKWLSFCGSFRVQSGFDPGLIPGSTLDQAKIISTRSGDDLRIEIKKFRERQKKWKVNLSSTCPQPVPNLSIHRQRHIQRHTPLPPKSWEMEVDADFQTFWQAYPNKVKKPAAQKAFLRARKENGEMAAILAGLSRHKESAQWKRGFIPHPATWLNNRQWEDDIGLDQVARSEAVTRREAQDEADGQRERAQTKAYLERVYGDQPKAA